MQSYEAWLQDVKAAISRPPGAGPTGEAREALMVQMIRAGAREAARHQLAASGLTAEQLAVLDEMLETLASMPAAAWNRRWYSPKQRTRARASTTGTGRHRGEGRRGTRAV